MGIVGPGLLDWYIGDDVRLVIGVGQREVREELLLGML